MAFSFSTTLRNSRANALITALGASSTMTFYTGTRPAALGAITSQTALATATFGSTMGTATNGVITLGAITQNSATFTAGTPTWVRFATSGGTAVMDIDIGSGAGNMQFVGAIATGVNLILNASTITESNA